MISALLIRWRPPSCRRRSSPSRSRPARSRPGGPRSSIRWLDWGTA